MSNLGSVKLGGGNVCFEVAVLAVPSILAMLVVSLYSICDIYFLSAVGETAVGGVCYPVTAVLQGVVMTFAFGSANKISASVGKGENGEASGYFSSGFIFGVVVCLVLGCLVGIFPNEIADFCGGGNGGGGGYLAVGGFLLPFFFLYFYYSACLRGVGKANVVMIASVIGLVLNFTFDFFAVVVLNLGVIGVAVATGLAQLLSGGFMAVYSQKQIEVFRPSLAFLDFFCAGEIISLGSSSFFRQLMCGLSAITLNFVCGKLGGNTLAGATVASRISVLLFSFGLGVGQGMQPVLAYYFGGGENKKARQSLIFAIWVGIALSIVIGVLQFYFADKITRAFADGGEIAVKILRFSALSTPFSFLLVIINMAFQAVGSKVINAIIATLRQGVIFIPTLLILSKIYQTNGMIISHFLADVVAGLVSILFLRHLLKNGKLSKRV